MTRTDGENVGIMILFNNIYICDTRSYCNLGLTMASVMSVIYDQCYDQQAGCNIIVDVLLYNHSAH